MKIKGTLYIILMDNEVFHIKQSREISVQFDCSIVWLLSWSTNWFMFLSSGCCSMYRQNDKLADYFIYILTDWCVNWLIDEATGRYINLLNDWSVHLLYHPIDLSVYHLITLLTSSFCCLCYLWLNPIQISSSGLRLYHPTVLSLDFSLLFAIYPSIHPSIHPSIYPSILRLLSGLIYQLSDCFIYLCIDLLTCLITPLNDLTTSPTKSWSICVCLTESECSVLVVVVPGPLKARLTSTHTHTHSHTHTHTLKSLQLHYCKSLLRTWQISFRAAFRKASLRPPDTHHHLF